MTTAASKLELYLDRRWPTLRFEGFNCRYIAGTRIFTQHAWPGGNARDIFASTSMLDMVAGHLRANRTRFGIRTILWRTTDHWDHVHVDLWPKGYGTPPCRGGQERYQYSSGRIVRASGGVVPPQGTFGEIPEDDMGFTAEEQTALKALAPYSDFLVGFAQAILGAGPSTGSNGNYSSLLHVLECYRLTASKSGISPLNHNELAAKILGYD